MFCVFEIEFFIRYGSIRPHCTNITNSLIEENLNGSDFLILSVCQTPSPLNSMPNSIAVIVILN